MSQILTQILHPSSQFPTAPYFSVSGSQPPGTRQCHEVRPVACIKLSTNRIAQPGLQQKVLSSSILQAFLLLEHLNENYSKNVLMISV